MSFAETIQSASKKQSFRATVYAMNTLLIQKGIYTRKNLKAYSWNGLGKPTEKSEA